MGGVSTGSVSRESHYHGRDANILRGTVRLDNNGGFIQMAANFVPVITADSATSQNNSFRTATPIDASQFTGIELVVHCDVADTFNMQYVVLHLRLLAWFRLFLTNFFLSLCNFVV
jgi:Complex I intermediate-associated protein 30 (CIA30)